MATVRLIEDIEGFKKLKPVWDELYAANSKLRVFQSFDWNFSVWNTYHKTEWPDDRLYIIHATRDGHETQNVILPFCLENGFSLRFIGSYPSDVLDGVYGSHRDSWCSFYCDIFDFIRNDPRVRQIALTKMEPNSEVLQIGGACLVGVEVKRHDSYSYFSAMAGEDPFARDDGALTSKERSYLRSLVRRGAGRRFEVLSLGNGQDFPREELCRLRQEMIAAGLRNDGFFPHDVMDHIENMYRSGLCEISVFRRPDSSLEYAGFRILNHVGFNFWIVLYLDKRDVTMGDVLYMREVVRRKETAGGGAVFDFGTGVYRYKIDTFRPRIQHLYSIFSKKPWHPSLRCLMKDAGALLRKYARVWLGRESEKERECRQSLHRYV